MKAEYLYLFIILFAFITLLLVVSMLMIVLRKKAYKRLTNVIARQLEGWIMDVILENNVGPNYTFAVPGKIQLLLQTGLAKKVLLREMMKVKKSLSGTSGINLEKVYIQLGLQEISLNRINNKHWHVKAKGIQELAIMNQHQYQQIISQLTNNHDHMVRMEAQIAMVRLDGYKGLHFFDNLTYPLTDWLQVNLLQLLANQPITVEMGIINWLHSGNVSVIQFSLKLIAEQHAIEFQDEVISCLNHESKLVRQEAVLCLGQMPSAEVAEELKARFIIERDINIRLCIINEFIKTGSGDDLPFLKKLFADEDVDIKLAANKTVLYLQKTFNTN